MEAIMETVTNKSKGQIILPSGERIQPGGSINVEECDKDHPVVSFWKKENIIDISSSKPKWAKPASSTASEAVDVNMNGAIDA